MNNRDENEFAYLLHEGDVYFDFISSHGGPLGTYSYEYTIFSPKIQQHLTGCQDLREYDGIHQYDFAEYVGVGDTLKEAWDEFRSKVDLEDLDAIIERVTYE